MDSFYKCSSIESNQSSDATGFKWVNIGNGARSMETPIIEATQAGVPKTYSAEMKAPVRGHSRDPDDSKEENCNVATKMAMLNAQTPRKKFLKALRSKSALN